QITFHPRHEIPRVRSKVSDLLSVFGRDDEAKLMAVVSDAILEFLAIDRIKICRVQAARFAISTDTVALDVAKIVLRGCGTRVGHDYQSSLDDDAAGARSQVLSRKT